MTAETDLAQRLAEAHRSGTRSVDQSQYAGLDRGAAYRVQAAVMSLLGRSPGMLKVAVAPDGTGTVAPIYAGGIGDSGTQSFPSARVSGLEVEVGVVLKHDLPPGSDRAAVEAAVGRYFMGVEVCGTRYADRSKAAYDVALADSMSALGYVMEARDWERGADLAGLDIDLRFNGASVYAGPAKHGFGGVLESLAAYAALAERPYALKAGGIVTTGSLCGLVRVSGAGKARAKMGGHIVDVEFS